MISGFGDMENFKAYPLHARKKRKRKKISFFAISVGWLLIKMRGQSGQNINTFNKVKYLGVTL